MAEMEAHTPWSFIPWRSRTTKTTVLLVEKGCEEKGAEVLLTQQRSSTSEVMRANDVVDVTRKQGV